MKAIATTLWVNHRPYPARKAPEQFTQARTCDRLTSLQYRILTAIRRVSMFAFVTRQRTASLCVFAAILQILAAGQAHADDKVLRVGSLK